MASSAWTCLAISSRRAAYVSESLLKISSLKGPSLMTFIKVKLAMVKSRSAIWMEMVVKQ